MKTLSSNPTKSYCIYQAEWRGISLEIGHAPSWLKGIDHIEIRSANNVPIPITETGYKSLFIPSAQTDITSNPVTNILAWLDHDADIDAPNFQMQTPFHIVTHLLTSLGGREELLQVRRIPD